MRTWLRLSMLTVVLLAAVLLLAPDARADGDCRDYITGVGLVPSVSGSGKAAFGFAAANIAEPLVGASLLLAVTRRSHASNRAYLFVFVACSVVIAPLLGSTIGAGTSGGVPVLGALCADGSRAL